MKKTKRNPDPAPLRLLILEDNPADAELVERQLRKAGIGFTSRLVEGKKEFNKALADFQPQIILSDFKLPRFDGLAALEMARTRVPDTPFIFVSGSIGEEKAIETLALGASDYILKNNLQRLGPAVKRVIEETRLKLEKKKSDEELRRRADELRPLAEAADHFVRINDLDQLYDYLAQTIPAISGADYLLLSLYDEKLQAVRPKIVIGFEPFRETIRRRFNIDLLQMVFYFKDMRPDDFSDFVSRRLLAVREGLYGLANRKIPASICRLIEKMLAIGSMHTMGFSWENQLYGGLTVLFKKGNELKNQAQVETMLNQATVSIKRLLAERSLGESEERFRRISETMSDISYSCLSDAEGNFSLSWMTGAADQITGYTIDEIMAMKCWEKLILAEDLPDFEKYVTGLTPGNSGICELRLRQKDGGTVWVQSFAECSQSQERPEQLILFGGLVDISERKRVETALRESEKKYRTLVTQSPDGIFVVGLQGNFLSANQAMCAGLKYSEAELLSLKIGDIVPEQYMDLHKTRLADILKGKAKNEAAEYMVRGKEGESHYVEILSAPFYKDNELIGFQGIARDITEKKKMENRLRESEEYYRTLVQTSPDAIIIVDAGGRCTFASSKVYEIFGIPAQFPIIGTSIMDFVKPDEVPRVQERLVEILSGRSLPEIREYRLLRHDRRPFWGEISSSPLQDASGRSIGLLLVCRDVSERKRTEIQIQYQANLLANVSDAIFATDRQFNIQYWNTAAEKQYGWTAAEVLGNHYPKYIQPQYPNISRPTVIKKIIQEGFWNGELLHNRRNGVLFPVQVTISEVRNAENQVIGHITIIRDISERKRAEAELLREKAFLEKLVETAPEGIAITDCPGRVLQVNGEFVNMFGYAVEEIVGKNIDDLIVPPEYLEEARTITQSVGAGKTNILETVRKRKDGTLFAVSIIGAPILIANQQVAVYAIYRDISDRKLAEEQIRASLKEKEVLLQEIHHRVKNNLQIISGLLTLQAEQSAGKSLDEIFRASQDRIRSIALIHEKLYRSRNLAEIAFDGYLVTLIENLFVSHGVAVGRIVARYDLEPILFTIEKAIPLGLIVNELVTNSLKHAFPNGRQGEIRISLHGFEGAKSYDLKTDSGTLHIVPTCELIVADDGIGLPAGQGPEMEKTLGMKLVSMLSQQLQAELKVKSGPGAEFRLLFPGLPASEAVKDKDHGG